MQQNNFIRRLMSITSSLAAIFSAYKSTKADSDFWFSLTILSVVLALFIVDEYIIQKRATRVVPPLKKLIGYSSFALLLISIGYLGYIYLPNIVENFKDRTSKENKNPNNEGSRISENPVVKKPEKAIIVNETPLESEIPSFPKPKQETQSKQLKLRTWHQLINNDAVSKAAPLEIWDTRGVTDLQARTFLSKIPRLSRHQMTAMGHPYTDKYDYRYVYYRRTFETWNQEQYYYIAKVKELGGYSDPEVYDRNCSGFLKNALKWRDEGIYENLKARDLAHFRKGIDDDCPRIILYQEFPDPTYKTGKYHKYQTYKRMEFHVFYFIEKEPFKASS